MHTPIVEEVKLTTSAYQIKEQELRRLIKKTKITDPDRIYGKGYGESILLNDCACEGAVKSDCSDELHAENRRTEFKVISTGNDKVKVTNTSPDSF